MVGLATCTALTVALLEAEETPRDLLKTGLPLRSSCCSSPSSRSRIWAGFAFDLMIRSVKPQEMEWHRTTARQYDTERDATR